MADAFPSNADGDSPTSIAIAQAILDNIRSAATPADTPAPQLSGIAFEQITRSFLQETLSVICPGRWSFNPRGPAVTRPKQYRRLAGLSELRTEHPEIAARLKSGYVIGPDILVVRERDPEAVIDAGELITHGTVAVRSSLWRGENQLATLRASISCKWTLRSGRAESAPSEALNLIRDRKGRLPHIAVVTAEPLPSRLAALALGTAGLDAVYHVALPELIVAIQALGIEDSGNLVKVMMDERRLKDAADLPWDLVSD